MIKLRDILLIISSLLLCSSIFSQGFDKLPADKVDKDKVSLAERFADRYFSAARDGKIYEFQNDATDAVIKGLTPDIQRQVYQDIKNNFGDYKSLEFVEAWKNNTGQIMTIIRFKGVFTNATVKPEIRIVIDEANKVAGFWYKSWEDELK